MLDEESKSENHESHFFDMARLVLRQTRENRRVLRDSISFRLGHALVEAMTSWNGLKQLPAALFNIRCRLSNRRRPKPSFKKPSLHNPPTLRAESAKRRLRIAAIMDGFTHAIFEPDCDLLQLHPGKWRREILDFEPDLLFLESSWRGSGGSWPALIDGGPDEIRELIGFCRDATILSVFWSKEDPWYYDDFAVLSTMVDYVFTTDSDCIELYKWELGHDRIFPLLFCVQPKIHNPLETRQRKAAFCFAGSYCPAYAERCLDFAALITAAKQYLPVDIYDRNYKTRLGRSAFPKEYGRIVLPRIDYRDIELAYKGYRWGITVNTIKHSPTMFARRAIELMACNTPVVSNYSLALRSLFGDCIVCSDSADELSEELKRGMDEASYRKRRLLGLRKVMSEYRCNNRLDTLRTVLGAPRREEAAQVCLVAAIESDEDMKAILCSFNRQTCANKRLVLVSGEQNLRLFAKNGVWPVHGLQEGCERILALEDEVFVGMLHPKDYYGENYVMDLLLAATYSGAAVFGKGSWYSVGSDGNIVLENDGKQYHSISTLPARASLIKREKIDGSMLLSWLRHPDSAMIDSLAGIGIDEFNYVREGRGLDGKEQRADL